MPSEPDQVRVVLDLDRRTDRISGSLDDGSHAPRTFYGWLELSAMLEQTREPGPNNSDNPRG